MARAKKATTPTSPQAKLASVIKTARDAMRKDAGLNGDLDRIPQLAWLLFLKAFDGLEQNREITDAKYRPAIEEPYRWRDWAADPNGATGEALLEFVNSGLLPYLRGLSGTDAHDPRDVLAAVFKETNNRMLSGYLLRDVVNKVNEINFASSDDIHTMAHLYESMLKDMRDAAGDSGEFYTPRPVIRFMVQQVAPQLGEVILDPACGTGGFLVEALEELEPKVETTQQRRKLHENLRGIEKKPLPYLLGMMNLILHGVGQPNVIRGNALTRPITQISRAERVHVVLTNPPFGGEEEKSIQANFPADKQTAETAWLFLQLVIRQLKDGGRCAIVVPNGILFGDGVGARIKQQLVTECNLHTIVRMPPGVFEPYTDIPTNILFFEKTGRTKETWYYELPLPDGRKKYSKTKPTPSEAFNDCQRWWHQRMESPNAWRASLDEINRRDFDLDIRNPNNRDDLAHRSAPALLDELIAAEVEALDLLRKLQVDMSEGRALFSGDEARRGWVKVELGDLMASRDDTEDVEPSSFYRIAGVYSFGRGLIDRGLLDGAGTSYRTLGRLHVDDVVISKLGAWEGAVAVVDREFDGFFVSSEFPTFRFTTEAILPSFFRGATRSPYFWDAINMNTRGSMARRKRITPNQFLRTPLWLPPMDEQAEAADQLALLDRIHQPLEIARTRAGVLPAAMFNEVFKALTG